MLLNGHKLGTLFNPIPTGHGRNQPIYECHLTTAGRNRVNITHKKYVVHLAPSDLKLSLRQWGAGNVYLIVLYKAKRLNTAENSIAVMGL